MAQATEAPSEQASPDHSDLTPEPPGGLPAGDRMTGDTHNLHVMVKQILYKRFLKVAMKRGQKITEAIVDAINLYVEKYNG